MAAFALKVAQMNCEEEKHEGGRWVEGWREGESGTEEESIGGGVKVR